MPGDVDVVDSTFVEMPGNDGVAGAEIRIFADPARAQHATVADFEQPSFKMIGHVFLRIGVAQSSGALLQRRGLTMLRRHACGF
jgi:hypothetical protein